mgnify:FL=1|jgi:cold shock protein
MKGTVKFYNRMKRFGFVSGEDGNEYFVHESGLADGVSIDEGSEVEFEVVDGDRGPKAEKVVLASSE